MTRKPLAQRIAEIEARKRTLVARLGRQERARDTRRKILLGALVLHHLKQSRDPESAERLRAWLRAQLPRFLAREADRQLFDDLIDTQVSNTGNPGETGNRAGKDQ
jgi:hypothetical protein